MDKDILLKSWEIYQNLVKSMSDSMWKIKSIYFTVITAFITYAYVNNIKVLYLILIGISFLFFLLDAWYKILEFKFIKKSHDIETALEDIIAEEEDPRIPNSLKTNTESITLKEVGALLKIKRIIFWLPYLVIIIVCLFMWLFNFKAEKQNEPKKKIQAETEHAYNNQGEYYFYFEKNSIILSKKNIIQNELLLNKIKNVNSTYIIQIRGYASSENMKDKTSFSDNYQLSNARCISVKDYILKFFDKKNIPRKNILVDIYPYSNQYSTNQNHSLNRIAIITIQEHTMKEIDKIRY